MATRPMTNPDPSTDPPLEPWMKPRKFEEKSLKVQINGPAEQKGPFRGTGGWNSGDIDFREDGSLFIRNPYLANAIEEQILHNLGEIEKDPENTKLFLFRLTRDRGWSGGQQNIVC